MFLKEKLRKFNRKLRNAVIYDRLYLKARALLKGEIRPKIAGYYHDHYTQMPVIAGRVLLDAFSGRMIGCNPYALYLEMRADPRCAGFNYTWVCNDDDLIPEGMLDDPVVSFVAYQSFPYQDALLTAQYLIGNTNFPVHFVKKTDQIYINPWHGTPIKHIGLDADSRFVASSNTQRNYFMSDFIILYSAEAIDRTVKSSGAHDALNRVHEIGTPRLDLTLRQNRDEMRKILNVTSDRPILLYAPTWRGQFGNKNTHITEQIENIEWIYETFCDTYEIYISVHYFTAEALVAHDVSFRQVPKNIPINQVLAGVDVLISDYSSIVVDFLVLDRPIVLFCPDFDAFKATQGMYFDLEKFPAAFCKTQAAVKDALITPAMPSQFETYPYFHKTLLPHEDGTVSKRALDIIFGDAAKSAVTTLDKIRLVFYAGGFLSNGITSSIISLTNTIDYDKYDVAIVFDAAQIDKDANRQVNLNRLAPQCRFVTRTGVTTYTQAEAAAYARLRQTGAYVSPEDRTLIDAVFSREARRIFGNQSYDVAIDFSGYGPFWALVLSHVNAGKTLIYQHNDMQLEACNPNSMRSFPELPAVFSLYERYDGIISVTEEIKEVNQVKLAQYYADGTQFHSVQNVISGNMIKTRAEVPLSLISPHASAVASEKGLYLFCCVARLSPEKNHIRILDAFAQVIKVNLNCVLMIIGDGKLAAMLKKHAQKLGIKDHVLFLGHRDNPYPIIKACDCMVLSSFYEGQGIVLLEALTLGLKCIATDNPAIRNVLKDGRGTIVPQDTDALADAMLTVAKTGKIKNPPFDAEGYAASALQQFYDTL
jgi:CDP-glycerol glycerophosphotransferase